MPPTLGSGVFYYVKKWISLYVPEKRVNLYKATENSKEWTAPVPVGNAKVIKAKAFYLGKQSVTTLLELNK